MDNHYELHSSLQQYYHAFQIYVDIIQNMDNMSSGEELPLSLYRSRKERQQCLDRISSSLDSIKKLNNQTLTVNGSSEHIFVYEDMSLITSVDDICFGDYIVYVQQAIGKIEARNIFRYTEYFDNLTQRFYSISVPEITASTSRLRKDIEEHITRYSRKDISKLQVCDNDNSQARSK